MYKFNSNLRETIFNIRDAVVNITSKFDTETKIGNGFFIKGHFIICPASLVLAKKNENITCANRILVVVSNVHDEKKNGKAYSYEANILGTDGAANIAILYINYFSEWNKYNPEVFSCHSFLNWGKSRNLCQGDLILTIGDLNSYNNSEGSENGVTFGILSNNRHVSYNGSTLGELLLLSNMLYSKHSIGLPVISENGKVVGMIIDFNIALSEFFMRRSVKPLIDNFIKKKISPRYYGFIEKLELLSSDTIHSFYIYLKAFIGVKARLVVQDDFFIETKNKEIIGYLINHVEDSLDSSLNLSIGDIITHIDGCPLGDRKGQISPHVLLWRVRPGNSITLTYKKKSDFFNITYNKEFITKQYKLEDDFPSSHFYI